MFNKKENSESSTRRTEKKSHFFQKSNFNKLSHYPFIAKMATLALALVLSLLIGAGDLWAAEKLPSATADGKGLVLVENGVSRVPIVVFENAPPFTRRAADELAQYI